MHGGSAPQVLHRARVRLIEQRGRQQVREVFAMATTLKPDYAEQVREYVAGVRDLCADGLDRVQPPLTERRRDQIETALDGAIERKYGIGSRRQ